MFPHTWQDFLASNFFFCYLLFMRRFCNIIYWAFRNSKTKPVRNKPFVAEFWMMVSITSTLNKNQQNHWSHVNFMWNNKWTKKKNEKIQFHSCFWQRTSFLITFMSHLICDTNDGKLKETNYIWAIAQTWIGWFKTRFYVPYIGLKLKLLLYFCFYFF